MNMPLSFSSKVCAKPDVLVSCVEGESVLLNLASESYFGLDEIGTRMWSVLTASSSIESAYRALLNEYEVGGEQLRKDLGGFVQTLLDHGLVELKNG
jgi:hypothetical protein